MTSKLKFISNAVKNLKSSGTLTPSSKYLAEKMLVNIDFSQKNVFVEFGPGNGVFTKLILERMTNDSILYCFEINQTFYNDLSSKIIDERFVLLNESAENIDEVLQKNHHLNCNYIISSLPLSNIPKTIIEKILINSQNSLSEKGKYIQFQYTKHHYRTLKNKFNSVTVDFEARNLPPAFIYTCSK